jgi:hypothetical protein
LLNSLGFPERTWVCTRSKALNGEFGSSVLIRGYLTSLNSCLERGRLSESSRDFKWVPEKASLFQNMGVFQWLQIDLDLKLPGI